MNRITKLLAPVVLVGSFGVTGVVGSLEAAPAHAQQTHPVCLGESNGMTQDYEFTGTAFTPGRTYVVGITPPNAPTFYGVATADSTGGWGEYWLPDQTGSYKANVYNYWQGTLGRWVTACSLVVS